MGYLRLSLAIGIMAAHMTTRYAMAASCAVWIFYAISGYLMTLLCATRYDNALAFWQNRILRIFPTYWLILAATVWGVVIWGYSESFPLIVLPAPSEWVLLNWQTWWGSFLGPRTIQPSWALTVELFWWGIISLGWIGKNTARYWMALGALITVLGAYPLGPIWFSLWGGMLPFSIGAWAYHNGLLIARDGSWGAMAGALSYPLFLSHYSVGAAVSGLTGLGNGWPLFWASLGPTITLSWLLWRWIDAPVNRFRTSRQLF
jgi:peptidoglycan/LPS O-acetylase OafA/YrhL